MGYGSCKSNNYMGGPIDLFSNCLCQYKLIIGNYYNLEGNKSIKSFLELGEGSNVLVVKNLF